MIRHVELVRLVQDAVPQALIPVFVFITYLGSAGVLTVAVVLWYWFDGRDRHRSAFVLAMVLCGYGLTIASKEFFALARPPASLHLIAVSGYGFPSGHALVSTIVYGTLALVLSVSTRRRRVAGAAVVVGSIAVSRVVLGVHYPADVVAGVVVGGAFLAVVTRFVRRDPLWGFWLAVVAGGVAFGVSGSAESIVLVGSSAGCTLAWWWLNSSPKSSSRNRGSVITVVGIVVLAAGTALRHHDPLVWRTLAAALAFGGVVAIPAVANRVATVRQ